MSNAEDLNRLTACSLVLLGHIFYVLGNHRVSGALLFSSAMEIIHFYLYFVSMYIGFSLFWDKGKMAGHGLIPCIGREGMKVFHVDLFQESNNMVVPAMQLASKIPDMSVQLWSSALLKGKEFTLHLAYMAK